MGFAMILPAYLIWHYTTAYTDIMRLWVNYIWFLYNFFSIPLLIKTLFSPWQRITEHRRRASFSFEDIAEVIMVNTIMRFVGFIIRLVFIVIGAVTVVVVFWAGICLFLVWTLAPILVPASIIYSLDFLL